MNEDQLQRAIGRLAERQIPGGIDLWPDIRLRLQKNPLPGKGMTTPAIGGPFPRKALPLLVPVLAVVLVGLFFAVTPMGRAWAQDILRYFTRSGGDTIPRRQLTPFPEETTPDPSGIQNANRTVGEVGSLVGFDVLEPTWLPGILSFAGANYDSNLKIAYLFYRYMDTNGLVLREQNFLTYDDCELCGLVGASAAVETVKIGETTGEYVEGVWTLTDNGAVWDPTPYLKTLRWQADGMAFELLYMGPTDTVSTNDLIAIAESLK
jgi:hypothetical protein